MGRHLGSSHGEVGDEKPVHRYISQSGDCDARQRDRVEGAYYTSSIPFCIGSLTLVLFYT